MKSVKKILLFNCKRSAVNTAAKWPHLGLVWLATVLRKDGYDAKVVDYAFYPKAPAPNKFVEKWSPDIVGVSLYTAAMTEADKLIDEVLSVRQLPIMVGGPHASLYSEELRLDRRLSYIVRGEAEGIIIPLVEKAKNMDMPEIAEASQVDVKRLVFPDFSLAWGYRLMEVKPIQLSRGCPYNCSFCEVKDISSRKVRMRDVADCVREVTRDSQILPKLRQLRIVDDCPTIDIGRFNNFLESIISKDLGLEIHVDNMRADLIDERMLLLLKRLKIDHICIGVESGNPEVFKKIDKGETLERIEKAARMVKKNGLRLFLCFVIGLPESDYRREEDSLLLAKRLRPNWVYWNMCVPHRGTRVREWFKEHGRLFDEIDFSSLIDYNLDMDSPPAETDEFPRWERERMWLRATLETGCFIPQLTTLPKIIRLVAKYRLWKSLPIALVASLRTMTDFAGQYFCGKLNQVRHLSKRKKALENAHRMSILRKLAAIWPYAPSLILWRAHEARALQDVNLEQPILDLGCGDGIFFSQIFSPLQAHGCDIDKEMLKRANKTHGYASLTCCNVAKLPYRENSFRTVFSNCVLEHIEDIDHTIAEISRVLIPGGRLVFTVVTPVFEKWFIKTLIWNKLGFSRRVSRIYSEYTILQKHVNVCDYDWWSSRLTKAGLSLERVNYYITFSEFKTFLGLDRLWHRRLPLPGLWSAGGISRLAYGLSLLVPRRAASLFWSWLLRKSYICPEYDQLEGPGMLIVATKLDSAQRGKRP